MLEPKAILRFAAILVVTLALLMWPWQAWQQAYAGYFRGLGDAAFSQFWFWSAGSVRFVNLRAPDVFDRVGALVPVKLPEEFRKSDRFKPEGEFDTLLLLQNRNAPGAIGILRTSSRDIAYWSSAMVVALVMASPLAWRKKAWLFLWTFVAVHLFIIVRLSVFVAVNGFFDGTKNYCLHKCWDFVLGIWRRMEPVLCDNPTVSFVVPVFIWLIVLVGMQIWSSWREDRSRASPAPPTPRPSR